VYKLDINNIDLIIFDFDGVLTDNKVIVNQNGEESVNCNRSDGLGFDVLRKINKPVYIISTEKNPVVKIRANKIGVPVIQGTNNKANTIINLVKKECIDIRRVMYIGNDLNDYYAMKLCGYSICPYDSHVKIKNISSFVLKTKGGFGILRELLEDVFQLNLLKILYGNKE